MLYKDDGHDEDDAHRRAAPDFRVPEGINRAEAAEKGKEQAVENEEEEEEEEADGLYLAMK